MQNMKSLKRGDTKSKRTAIQTRRPPSCGELWSPHEYQKVAIKWLVSHPEAALLLDPGLGKTSVTLAAFQALRVAKACRKMLVIAPLRPCYQVWSKYGEMGRWSNFSGLSVALLHGPGKAEELEKDADVYVINPDGLGWLIDQDGFSKLKKRGVDVLAIDELSKFKHTRTYRFKLIRPYLRLFKRRWGLTGSPAANGYLDLFGQMYALDLGSRLGQFITWYRNEFFLPTGFDGKVWVLQNGAEKKIQKRIADLALSMRAKDKLDLPPLVQRDIMVDLPKSSRKVYDGLEEDLFAMVGKDAVSAANAAVSSGKCRQVASGGLYVTEEKEEGDFVRVDRRVTHLHDEKTEALADLVDELQGSPLLVVYQFDHDLDRIRAKLGKHIPAINGRTKPAAGMEIAKAWNVGDVPILCGHPAAMGHGLNLQGACHHICWYSLTWNFEEYDQTVRRVYRQGQKERVFVHHILARKTVDMDVARALNSKRRVQDDLMHALREGLKERWQ